MYTEGHLQITYKYYIILHKELENPQILASEVGMGPGTNLWIMSDNYIFSILRRGCLKLLQR